MNKLQVPATRTSDVTETLFGVTVHDPYRWLEDVKSPEVQTWMAAQDGVARGYLAGLPGRESMAARLRQLYYVDSVTAPLHRGANYFYLRTLADREKAILYWRKGEQGEEKVLIDPNILSPDGSVSLGGWVPSWDGKTLAYMLRPNNADEATIHVMDVATGKVSEIDVIPEGKYASPGWTPDGGGFYYTFLPRDPSIPTADRPGWADVRFHRLGTDPSTDRVIHGRTGDARTFITPDISRDGRWLFIYIQHGWNSNDIYYRDLTHAGDDTFTPLIVGRDAHFHVVAWKDDFYILTDEGAPRFRIFKANVKKLARDQWKEIVSESQDAVIENLQVIGGHLVLSYMRNAANEMEVRTLDGRPVRTVPLPEIGSASAMSGNPDEDDAYFSFTSFLRAREVYKTSIRTGETSLWASVKLPIDISPFKVEQVWYPSKDGTRVSMFLVHRKDLPHDGSTPFLLEGYGGFNVPMLPAFASRLIPWLEAGGGFAMPNLRGGGEYGEAWHRAGMQANKQNVFDDFTAAAQYLIAQGYTRPERLAIRGGSNGGLLMGAMITQHPELFKAVICGVPLLDMIRYHLFGSGRTWIGEYGSAETEEGFRQLYAYSPYHHIKPGTDYPALLMMTADNDDRVDPMHARKMTAALQAASSGAHPILMRIEKNSGHGGADLVKQAVEQWTDTYAFLMHELGMTPADSRSISQSPGDKASGTSK